MNPIDKFARIVALKPARPLPLRSSSLRAPDGEDSLSRLLGAGIATNRYGEHVCIRNWYSTPEFVEPALITLDLLSRARDTALSKRTQVVLSDPSKWLFLDTETTGISGGTGTYAFLVGLAWWDAGGLQVEQFIMRDFAEEHSILHELAVRLTERPVLVTFNGKTFDWPLLENRFTMTRAIRVPHIAAHLDLLHPARALWKFRLGTVRLVDLERDVLDPRRLGWTRKDDVPTSLIPQVYFDYLRGGPPGPLAGVVRHNQMDLRGLAALFGKMNDLLGASEGADHDTDSLDLFGLSRFFQRRSEPARAFSACTEAVRLGLPPDVRSHACRDLAILAKRRGDHQRAAELWHELLADDPAGIEACIELAIHYERRAKDYTRALQFAHLALAKARRAKALMLDPPASARNLRLQQTLRRRIDRLDRRIKGDGRTLPLQPASDIDELIVS